MFDALRESTEKRMFTIIDQKIDQLFDNVNINWCLTFSSPSSSNNNVDDETTLQDASGAIKRAERVGWW